MSSQIAESLTNNQKKELRRLRKTRSRRFLAFCIISFIFFFGFYQLKKNYTSIEKSELTVEDARRTLVSSGTAWSQNLDRDQRNLQDWLERRGTSYEFKLYSQFSTLVFYSAHKTIKGKEEAQLGFLDTIILWLHFGILRIAFMVLACSRLWIIIVAFGAYRGLSSWKPYDGADALGETGNSRLFYSGIRAGLDNLNPSGAPNKQVRGLACPRVASEAKLKGSKLYSLLNKYNVANKTNQELAAVIIEYVKVPPYVTQAEEQKLMSDFTESATLEENTTALLERILDLQKHYKNQQTDAAFSKYLADFGEFDSADYPLSLANYAKYVQKSLHRVLTDEFRDVIGKLEARHLCTMVMALEAGKIMAFSFEGGRWLRKSNYPQLCARSILHSMEFFSSEYNFDERTVIRKALIYASRASDFGPVKLALDLSDESRALRQWSEVLLANPHDLNNVANEVEMYALLYQANKNWSRAFFDAFMLSDRSILDGIYCTQGNLVLVPFTKMYKMARRSLSSHGLKRLEHLVALVGQQQKLKAVTSDPSLESIDSQAVAAQSKAMLGLPDEEIKLLSKTYKLPEQAVREWSTLRMIMNNFGWMARRVGDYTVSESSLIFAVLRANQGTKGINELGLVGEPAMVPLRSTQLEARWGKTWQSRVTQVVSATMAENMEDYAKLMRGESLYDFEDSTMMNG